MIHQHTADEEITVLAASLCNAFNGGIAWDFLMSDAKDHWRRRAREFSRELGRHEWAVIALDELPGN